MNIGETDIGCSSFTAKTPDGDILFARNYDFAKTNVCITLCDPGKGRHASFSTVDLPPYSGRTCWRNRGGYTF